MTKKVEKASDNVNRVPRLVWLRVSHYGREHAKPVLVVEQRPNYVDCVRYEEGRGVVHFTAQPAVVENAQQATGGTVKQIVRAYRKLGKRDGITKRATELLKAAYEHAPNRR